MGTTADKLQAALDSKNDVQAALNEQGVEATEDFSTYGPLIRTELTNRETVEAHIKDTRAHSPILVNITSEDGVAYTGTIENLTELYAGLSITVIPNKASTSADCTLNLNSLGAKNIKHTSTVNTETLTTPGHADWMSVNAPITMTYNGTQWVASSIFAATPAPLYVTMTGNEEDGYSVDKTFEEIFNAFIQDRVVRLLGQGRYGYEEYRCVYSESGMLAFTYQLNETLKKVYITSDNTVGYVEEIIFSESNPPTAEQVKAVGWENVNLSTGSIKTWALNQNAPTSISVTNNVTDMPEDDKFWIAILTIAKAGTWRKLIATEITDGTTLPKSYECICKEGTWSGWSGFASKSDLTKYQESNDTRVTALESRPVNDNILINSNFANPVNQRGVASGTWSWGYCIDRWIMGGNPEVTLNSDSISIKATNEVAYFSHRIEFTEKLLGKELSLSAKVNGKVYEQTISFDGHNGDYGYCHIDGNCGDMYVHRGDDGFLAFNISTFISATNTIEWAKLELGDRATPYVPRMYGEELALCMRYFQRIEIPAYRGSQIGSVEGNSQFKISYHTMPMRIQNPTATIKCDGNLKTVYSDSTSSEAYTVASISTVEAHSIGSIVYLNLRGISANTKWLPGRLITDSDKPCVIDISAEL